MNKIYPVDKKKDGQDLSLSLAESMDQSIGEATTVMGAMITELMRRSLRGGIVKVGEELSSYVADQVDTTLTERVPELERAACAVAETTAQEAATRVATVVATGEVQALESRTNEVTRTLSTRLEDTHRRTEEATEKAQILEHRIEDVDRRAVETTRQTAAQLTGKIEETEKRVCEMTQAEINQRLNEVLERAREGSAIIKTRLKALEDLAEGLGERIHEEQTSRKAEFQAGLSKAQQSLDQLGQKLNHGIELVQARLKDEVREIRQAHEDLANRVAALEQPKGFFARLFSKKKDS